MAKQDSEKRKELMIQASQALDHLVTSIGLQRIVCVDDFFAIMDSQDFSTFYGLFKEFGSRVGIEELASIEDEQDEAREAIEAKWEAANEETRLTWLRNLHSHKTSEQVSSVESDPPSVTQDDHTTFTELKELCNGNVDYIELSLTQWKQRHQTLLSESDTVKTLFLFDENLESEGGRKQEGISLMISAQHAANAYCGLFSQRFRSDQELIRWSELKTDYPDIDENRCVPIAKQTLLKKPLEFVRRIKYTSLINPCHLLCNELVSEMESAYKQAHGEVQNLSIYEFDQIILRKSFEEGMWEVDALLRLFALFHRDLVRPRIQSNRAITTLIESIRRVSEVPSGNLSDAAKLQSWRLQQRELYDDGEHINTYHLPLECGDIFEDTGSHRMYILLGQPCDLMLRINPTGSNGKSGERRQGVNTATLLEIKDIKNDYSSELPYLNDNKKPYYASYSSAFPVRLDVLDMCVYNSDGTSQMTLNEPAPTGLLPVWQSRYQNQQDELGKVLDKWRRFSNIRDEELRQTAQQLLLPSASEGEERFKGRIDQDQERLQYNIKRIKRLETAHSRALLAQFMSYLSRPAFDVDWGKEGK